MEGEGDGIESRLSFLRYKLLSDNKFSKYRTKFAEFQLLRLIFTLRIPFEHSENVFFD